MDELTKRILLCAKAPLRKTRLMPMSNLVFCDGANAAITDGMCGIIAGIAAPTGSCGVDAGLIGGLLSEGATIEIQPDRWIVHKAATSAKITLPGVHYPVNDFLGAIPHDDEFSVEFPCASLWRALRHCSADNSVVSGLLFDPSTGDSATTDGHRVAWVGVPVDSSAVRIPASFAAIVPDGIACFRGSTELWVKTELAYYYTKLMGYAPNLESVIRTIGTGPRVFIKRASMLDILADAHRIQCAHVSAYATGGKLHVSADNSPSTAKAAWAIDCEGDCDPFSINPAYMADALRRSTEEYASMTSAKDATFIDDCELIMKVRR